MLRCCPTVLVFAVDFGVVKLVWCHLFLKNVPGFSHKTFNFRI